MKTKILVIIVFIIVIASVCFANELPEIQNITLSGDVLSWDEFEGASKYDIEIRLEGRRVRNVRTTLKYFNIKNNLSSNPRLDSGAYIVELFAVDENATIITQKFEFEYYYNPDFVKLNTPTGIDWINGYKAKWNAVDNADSYIIELQIGQETIITRETENIFYDFTNSNVIPENEIYRFRVKAKSSDEKYIDSDYSKRSQKMMDGEEVVNELIEIQNVILSGDILSWDTVDIEGCYYHVGILNGGGSDILDATSFNLRDFAKRIGLKSGTHSVSLEARDEDDMAVSIEYKFEYVYEADYPQLATPTNLRWENGYTAAWNAVENAFEYVCLVYINGNFAFSKTVTDNYANFEDDDRIKEDNAIYSFKIYATSYYNQYPRSEYSEGSPYMVNGNICIKGDINFNSSIDIADIRLVLQAFINSVNYFSNESKYFLMDMNEDKTINIIDIRLLLQQFVNQN